MKKLLVVLGFLISACEQKQLPTLQGLALNRGVVKDFKENNLYKAKEKIIEGLSVDPYQSENHINLGLSQELSQEYDNALLSYAKAEELSKDQLIKFISYFNRAQLLAKQKKIDEALDYYQKALGIVPNSKEVKINIELLIQQQQQQGGSGDEQNQDQKNDQNKDQSQNGKGKDSKDSKDQQKDQKSDQENQDEKDNKDKENKNENKEYKQSQKYKPREFKGKDLKESDVNKILGEIKQQEQKIRAQYFKSDVKEKPHEKDW